MDENYEDALKIASKKHDLVGLWIYDIRETELPDVGLMKVKDAETGEMAWIDTGSILVRNAYQEKYLKKQEETSDLLKKNGVDFVTIATHEDYVKPLMRLFNKGQNEIFRLFHTRFCPGFQLIPGTGYCSESSA